jgi:sec-independent protein translocase protein TatA
MFGLGVPELIIILVIVMIIFGAGKLPQIGEGLGKGIKNFRKATKNEEIDVTPEDDPKDGQTPENEDQKDDSGSPSSRSDGAGG